MERLKLQSVAQLKAIKHYYFSTLGSKDPEG